MKPRKLPECSLEQVEAAYPSYRQSLLSKADNCSLSTLFDLEGNDYTTHEQARGIIFHRYAAELLRTLWRTGEHQIPHEEAMQILYEVSRQREVEPHEVVVVPARERRLLRICALALANTPLDMSKVLEIETRHTATLNYDHPVHGRVERTISGTPDVVVADPPHGLVVIDWKTAPSAPAPTPTNEQGDEVQAHWTGDHLHVSYEGYFQQRFYALLLLRAFPEIQYVTLRERYVLPRESRNATVPREALEHIEQELAVDVELLDRAIEGGSASELWKPSPGKHCDFCRRPTSCPIEAEARELEGGVTSQAQAERIAAETIVAQRIYKDGMEACKAWHDATSRPIPVRNAKGRQELRWGQDSKGKRRFKIHPVETSDRGPRDPELEQTINEAAERKAEAA